MTVISVSPHRSNLDSPLLPDVVGSSGSRQTLDLRRFASATAYAPRNYRGYHVVGNFIADPRYQSNQMVTGGSNRRILAP